VENHLQETDYTLIADIKQGDMNAFKKLVRKHQSLAFTLAFRTLGDENDANDVVQECFIRIWRNIDTFDLQQKFTAWMCRIISNLCVDRLRQRKRHAVSFSHFDSGLDVLNQLQSTDMEGDIDQREIGELINSLAQGLTPKQRLVFVLRDLQGMSIEEAGQTLQMRSGAVKSNLHLARRAIRKRLLEIDPELRNGY